MQGRQQRQSLLAGFLIDSADRGRSRCEQQGEGERIRALTTVASHAATRLIPI